MMLKELFFAIGLLLVLEGILPFLSPQRWRLMAARIAKLNDKKLRIFGLVLMLMGLVIVVAIHHHLLF